MPSDSLLVLFLRQQAVLCSRLTCWWTEVSHHVEIGICNYSRFPGTTLYSCCQSILHFLKMDLKLFAYVNLKGMKIIKIILKKHEL